MAGVASWELRTDTVGVLARVEAGADVVITVNGGQVARLLPLPGGSRRWLPQAELTARLRLVQADAGRRRDLADLTDDLDPIR